MLGGIRGTNDPLYITSKSAQFSMAAIQCNELILVLTFQIKKLLLLSKRTRQSYSFDDLCYEVADLIDCGNVVGWFQDRMEYGTRALGNRSILADARNVEMQKKMNLK